MLKLIGAMDTGRGIGFENKLLYKSETDMSYFKNQTMWGIVVMGYNTMQSLPKKYLPHRVNIVLTKAPVEVSDNVFGRTKEQIIEQAKTADIWVIGGERTYTEFVDYADEIHLTVFNGMARADTFFPPFELMFDEVSCQPFSDKSVSGNILVYKRKA